MKNNQNEKKVFLVFCLMVIYINTAFSKSIIHLKKNIVLTKVNFGRLNGWNEEDFDLALGIFINNCDRIEELPEDKNLFPQQIKKIITKKYFSGVCKIANVIKNYNSKYKQVFFEMFFVPYQVSNNSGVFTGYYIPTIKAKFTSDSVFKYPIYKRPNDLKDDEKYYYSRRDIYNGSLKDKHLELLYTDDLIELFFAQIQGSANVILVDDNNKIVSIVYDGKNNHKFSSIGNFLIKNNLISREQLNTIELKKYLIKNKKFAETILSVNDSYIFFKLVDKTILSGAFGSELVSYRTIAVDNDIIPLGFPLWIETKQTSKDDVLDFNKLVIANDTGSAIKGANRGDIFFGYGAFAEDIAGYQYSSGRYFLLIPTRIAKILE